jgi:archaellum biogenesis protein FlaJ (TadC family)
MGILSKIFGSGDVIEKGLDLIDSFHTSDEELIKANTDAKRELLTAYAPFKLAQRYLALLFSVTFIGSFLLVLGMSLSGKADVDVVRQVLSEFYIGEIMLSIILFYFGGGAFEGIINKTKGK